MSPLGDAVAQPTDGMTMHPRFYGTMRVTVVNQNVPDADTCRDRALTLPTPAATGSMAQMVGTCFELEGATRIDGQESNGWLLETQGKISGLKAGEQTFTMALNSGKATILTFKF